MEDFRQENVVLRLLPFLTTNRTPEGEELDVTLSESSDLFWYEGLVCGSAILISRLIVGAHKEPLLLKIFFATTLSFLAFHKKPYELIVALQMFSYAVPRILHHGTSSSSSKSSSSSPKTLGRRATLVGAIGATGAVCFILCQLVSSGVAVDWMLKYCPWPVENAFVYMFPVLELSEAYDVIAAFIDRPILHRQLFLLLFVTFNCQIGMGYLGIAFLKSEQERRNQLIRIDNTAEESSASHKTANGGNSEVDSSEKERERQEASKRFRRGAPHFIFLTVAPYMLRIVIFGNINHYAFSCVRDDLLRLVRLKGIFQQDSRLEAMSTLTGASPNAYAGSVHTIVQTSYDMLNRKMFSLPKIALIPGIITREPALLVRIAPFIFLSDWVKARVVSTLTSEVERLEKESNEIKERRTKIEQYDMKNAELLQRSGFGATEFTQKKWGALTREVQDRKVYADILRRTREYFGFLQKNFVFAVLVDCALANLLAIGRIVSSDIFLFSRAIEDAVDLVLMKSRAESQLATMSREVDKLQELATLWKKTSHRRLLPCQIHPLESAILEINNLHYSRGTAQVHVDHIQLEPGIYALTGANGSGKSTLFRILMSCNTNAKSIDLPPSILMSTPNTMDVVGDSDAKEDACDAEQTTNEECQGSEKVCSGEVPELSILMPSSDVAEISQTFYWPLHTRPVDWIYQTEVSKLDNGTQRELTYRVAAELQSLAFTQSESKGIDDSGGNETATVDASPTLHRFTNQLMVDLQEEKEDWFSDLSGGQKSKVELVRKIFLQEQCPRVLLIDETMAPLDPDSKSMVMSRLKEFCRDSIVAVIYHTDVRKAVGAGEGDEEEVVDCVPSNNFFDHNLHVENRVLMRRPVC